MSHRVTIAAAIALVLGACLLGPVTQLAGLVGAADWGSDWRWLEDGVRRLAAGEPLTRPEYVAGPFSQFDPGPAYTWSLHLPSTATLVAPSLLLPPAIRVPAWTLTCAVSVAVALWVAWPRRIWWGSHLLLAAVFLGLPPVGLSVALIDQLHYANPNGLVALGVALAWTGRRRGSAPLVALGVVLAAIKIVPAIALAAWLLAARDRTARVRTGLVAAVLILALLTVPVLVLDPGALGDALTAGGNLVPWADAANLAPRVRLAPLIGLPAATLASEVLAAVALGAVVLRRLDGGGGLVIATCASLLLTPQLWTHWFLVPGVAVLAAAGQWATLRRADETLRTAWETGPEALATG